MLTLSLLTSSFLLLAAADPLLSPYTLHEKRSHIPSGWSHSHKHHPTAVIPLRFGLSQSNIHNIADLLHDVSHPDSPNYGSHWSPARVAATFAPSTESVDTVHNWLLDSGFSRDRVKLTPSKSWIEVNATVEEAERLLLAEYHIYEHETGSKHIACDEYHLPAHVSPHVDLVMPTVHFNALGKRDVGPFIRVGSPGHGITPKTTGTIQVSDMLQCDQQIEPDCLRALYNMTYKPVNGNKNSFGIVEYTPQAYIPSDLDEFFFEYSSNQVGQRPFLTSIDGGVVQQDDQGFGYNGESNLDLQYAMALVGSQQPVTLYQVGDLEMGASFNNFLDALDGSYCTFEGGDDPSADGLYPDPINGGYKSKDCGTVTPASVISTSYGYNEADLSAAYTARQCAEYAKLGMMGVTVLYSSGDYGVAGNGNFCLNPDGSQSDDGAIFNPSFPSGCPYVTSVGATQVNPGKSVKDPESACQQVIYSGGGFSNRFAIPDYQKGAVGSYLANYHPTYSPAIWNSTGTSRAYPDVSANGANYVVVITGDFYSVYGTSASCPVFAAIITLVNDARITSGKPPVGFINPTIYSANFQGAFNDITSGGNPGCGTAGFTSVPGWDPVTGLGTPNLGKLIEIWKMLP